MEQNRCTLPRRNRDIAYARRRIGGSPGCMAERGGCFSGEIQGNIRCFRIAKPCDRSRIRVCQNDRARFARAHGKVERRLVYRRFIASRRKGNLRLEGQLERREDGCKRKQSRLPYRCHALPRQKTRSPRAKPVCAAGSCVHHIRTRISFGECVCCSSSFHERSGF